MNDIPQPVNRTANPPEEKHILKPMQEKKEPHRLSLRTDDIILIIVFAVLLINDCDDKLLLMALAYIFLSDFFG